MADAIINQVIGWRIEQNIETDEYAECHTEIGVECCVIGPVGSAHTWLIEEIKFAITGE